MSAKTIVRCFLVGCPRSGTTLLQSLIAAHSQVISFPETQFVMRLTPSRNLFNKFRIIGSRGGRKALSDFISDTGHSDLTNLIPQHAIFKTQYIRAFINILDEITKRENKNCWLEKSPLHLYHLDIIERSIHDIKVIHIIRNGTDVVASLYDVATKYKELWDSTHRNMDSCIEEWNNAIKTSSLYVHKPNHLIIRYEFLVSDPLAVMNVVFDFLGLPMEDAILERQKEVAEKLITESEKWKGDVSSGVKTNATDKFGKLFNDSQQKYIKERLHDISIFDNRLKKDVAEA